MSDTLILIVLGLCFIGWLIWIKFSEWQKKQQEQRKQREWDHWIDEVEPKFRNLHTYPEDWNMRRDYVAKRENYTCQECGAVGTHWFQVHHRLLLTRGGTNDLDNLVYLCHPCHVKHHKHMLTEQQTKDRRYDEELERNRRELEKREWWANRKSYYQQHPDKRYHPPDKPLRDTTRWDFNEAEAMAFKKRIEDAFK